MQQEKYIGAMPLPIGPHYQLVMGGMYPAASTLDVTNPVMWQKAVCIAIIIQIKLQRYYSLYAILTRLSLAGRHWTGHKCCSTT